MALNLNYQPEVNHISVYPNQAHRDHLKLFLPFQPPNMYKKFPTLSQLCAALHPRLGGSFDGMGVYQAI